MKKIVVFHLSLLLSLLLMVSCEESEKSKDVPDDVENEHLADKDKILFDNADAYATKTKKLIEELYNGFTPLFDLDNKDAAEDEFTIEIESFESKISTTELEINRMEPYGSNTEGYVASVKSCLKAIKDYCAFFRENIPLMSLPDEDWSDKEVDSFVGKDSELNTALEDAMDKLYEESENYLNSQN